MKKIKLPNDSGRVICPACGNVELFKFMAARKDAIVEHTDLFIQTVQTQLCKCVRCGDTYTVEQATAARITVSVRVEEGVEKENRRDDDE